MSELVSFGDILDNHTPQVIEGAQLVLEWPQVVEGEIRAHSRALKFVRGSLYVEVDSSAWASELSYYKEEIINRLKEKFKKGKIKDIKFLVKGDSYAKSKR